MKTPANFVPPNYTVYLLRTSSNTLYVGQTNNLDRRLVEHQSRSGKGAKYLRLFTSFSLVYTEKFTTRSDALKREAALKKLTHLQKEALISCR